MALLATTMTAEHARRLAETLREESLYWPPSEALIFNNRYEETDFTDLELQVNTNFDYHSHSVHISWRLRNLRGEFYLSEEVLYQTRNVEQFIRDRIREEVGRRVERNPQPQQFPRDDCIRQRELVINDSALNSWYQTKPTPRADQKAKELLLRFLAPHQRSDYKRIHSFDLTVPKYFGRYSGTYRLYRERVYNIHHLESNTRFCAAPAEDSGRLPIEDVLLAQKLMLETDPEGFLKKANKRDRGMNSFYTAISSPLSITTGYTGYDILNNTST